MLKNQQMLNDMLRRINVETKQLLHDMLRRITVENDATDMLIRMNVEN